MTIRRHSTVELPRSRCTAAFAAVLTAGMLLGGAPAAATYPTPKSGYTDGTKFLVSPGATKTISAADAFDDAGTNPKFVIADIVPRTYYEADSGIDEDGDLVVKVKLDSDLVALTEPPPNPFHVTVHVLMVNDENLKAQATWDFETTYDTAAVPTPTFKSDRYGDSLEENAPPGAIISVNPALIFKNAGTNPRFTEATFSTKEYYDESRILGGLVFIQVKSLEDLLALESPPSSPFEVTVDAKMTNDEGQTAEATIKFETSWGDEGEMPVPPNDKPENVQYGGSGADRN